MPPRAPFVTDQAEVRRAFGSVLDVLPTPEVVFTLYFDPESDMPLLEAKAQLQAILNVIRERRSTAISLIGHTDTTADPEFNYQLGLRRAQRVAAILQAGGVDSSDIVVASHGDTDLAVKTARGVAERRNRRVEVVVR
jgi:outer membrane protein OmpA-like peptidoglycan-associated protein